MTSSIKCLTGNLGVGKQRQVFDECPTAAGTTVVEQGILSDSVLVTLIVESVSGDLDVKVETVAGNDDAEQLLEIINFPTTSAPTTNLLIRKAAVSMDRIRVTTTYSDACKYQVYVRGISAGESSVTILGSNEARASQSDITTADVIISSSLTDRAGLVIKNYSSSDTLFIGFSVAEATTGEGFPLGPGEAMGLDVAAGQAVYGVSSGASIDVRLMEAGG